MKIVVDNNETLKRVEGLYDKSGMHPSLLFFEEGLHEN
eukprot:CAMPEP_0170507826 /NCGR_PEP_ID=MMETSP0208-20121228/60265_1 /TAXON_ID=197538 /ORGANISM="Strombidium inclinatum, Strain S3" /LENGTH=37 /DNA_ID= /DNA_START= /DNA_END= /DNA_ORIENTATION=